MSRRDAPVDPTESTSPGATCDHTIQGASSGVRFMSPTTVLIALAALLATSLSLKAEGSKPEQSQAEQPYTHQLGDNQVTSVKREDILPPARLRGHPL